MDITDCVRTDSGDLVRITGFYRIGFSTVGDALMIPCRADDARLSVIGSYALCGKFHHPWEISLEGPVRWPEATVRGEWAVWEEIVTSTTELLTERDYPALLGRYKTLSAHQKIRLSAWRTGQIARLAARPEWSGKLDLGTSDDA